MQVLSAQLAVIWLITMSPFLGVFKAPFAQHAHGELQVRRRAALCTPPVATGCLPLSYRSNPGVKRRIL